VSNTSGYGNQMSVLRMSDETILSSVSGQAAPGSTREADVSDLQEW
jgi:hypothetical protein